MESFKAISPDDCAVADAVVSILRDMALHRRLARGRRRTSSRRYTATFRQGKESAEWNVELSLLSQELVFDGAKGLVCKFATAMCKRAYISYRVHRE
jgi:hypothetical protein